MKGKVNRAMSQCEIFLSRRAFAIPALAILLLLAACGGQATSTVPPASTTVAQPTSVATTVPAAATLPVTVAPTTAAATQTLPPVATAAVTAPTAVATIQATPTTAAQAQVSPPTTCTGITPAQTEGPFYKANTPERASLLEPGITGTKLIVTGYVLNADCKPIAGAWLDFWQADDQGEYDNAGYKLRGHQFTDATGRYSLETIFPGLYTGRTRHIHVKVRAPNQPILTSQLYVPGEARNNSDGIFNPKLVVNLQDTPNGLVATFNFVLNVR